MARLQTMDLRLRHIQEDLPLILLIILLTEAQHLVMHLDTRPQAILTRILHLPMVVLPRVYRRILIDHRALIIHPRHLNLRDHHRTHALTDILRLIKIMHHTPINLIILLTLRLLQHHMGIMLRRRLTHLRSPLTVRHLHMDTRHLLGLLSNLQRPRKHGQTEHLDHLLCRVKVLPQHCLCPLRYLRSLLCPPNLHSLISMDNLIEAVETFLITLAITGTNVRTTGIIVTMTIDRRRTNTLDKNRNHKTGTVDDLIPRQPTSLNPLHVKSKNKRSHPFHLPSKSQVHLQGHLKLRRLKLKVLLYLIHHRDKNQNQIQS